MSLKWGPTAGYKYQATVITDIDGDTIKMDVDLGVPGKNRDLGFHVYTDEHGHVRLHQSCRVLGENAAEHGSASGDAATKFVKGLLPDGSHVVIQTKPSSSDKFGNRFDANVTLPDGRDLATVEITAGHALPWDGTGPKPVPD